jgi:hypothetical protein
MLTAMYVQVGLGWSTTKVALTLAEQSNREYQLRLKSFVPLAEICSPKIWGECRGIKQNDLIRIIMPDLKGGRDFDFKVVCVRSIGPTILMAPWPHLPGMADMTKEAEANGSVPRLEHAKAKAL